VAGPLVLLVTIAVHFAADHRGCAPRPDCSHAIFLKKDKVLRSPHEPALKAVGYGTILIVVFNPFPPFNAIE